MRLPVIQYTPFLSADHSIFISYYIQPTAALCFSLPCREKTADLQCLFIVSHQSALFQWVHCIILYILISAGLSDLTDSFLPIKYSLFYPVKSEPSSSCLHPLHRQLHGCGTAVGQKRTSAAVSRAAIVSRIPKLQKNRLKTAKRR